MHPSLLFSNPITSSRLWYLAGGIQIENVVAAYQFHNRNSQAESLLNLVNPNLHPMILSSGTVYWLQNVGLFTGNTGFGSIYGSQFTGSGQYDIDIAPSLNGDWSFYINFAYESGGTVDNPIFGSRIFSPVDTIFGLYPSVSGKIRFANLTSITTYPSPSLSQIQYAKIGVAGRDCYINGEYIQSLASPTTQVTPMPKVSVFNMSNAGKPPSNRTIIRKLSIYNKTLSAEQMKRLSELDI